MIWKDAKGNDHVSFKGCPGICLEMTRTIIETSVMTMCVIHPGICRVQVTVFLSYDKLLGQKEKRKKHELLIKSTSINIVVTYRQTVTTRIDSLYFASVFGSPPPVTLHVRHRPCHYDSVLAICP
jgi:hypothetical protein